MSDDTLRLAAFDYLARLTRGEPDVAVHWRDLVSFKFEGEVQALIGQRGIWKPKGAELPISITTAPPKTGKPAPYDDQIRDDDRIFYRYQGTDPKAHDNVWLRRLMWEKEPLIYFHGIDRGVYVAAWPVFIETDDPSGLGVTVNLSPTAIGTAGLRRAGVSEGISKQYIFVPTKRRLHQTKFREIVMRAYQRRCAICRLGHESLLDAAHIVPDSDAFGTASVGNGLSLCKIHHAAFDRNIIGIDPDLVVHVREDILAEVDGPMLQHGIKAMDRQVLAVIPRKSVDRPLRDQLDRRFQEFRSA